MQYPIFISVAETARLLSLGKTSVFARIKDRSLKAAKMRRSTRVTFSSVIEYARRCLQEGNGQGALSEMFGDAEDVQSWIVAERFAQQLCYTPQGPNEGVGSNTNTAQSPAFDANEAGSPKKNFGGEF